MFRDSDGWAVYVVSQNRAELRKVEPGQSGGIYTRVLSGLEAGEKIINYPGDNLEVGSRVRVR